MRFFSFPKLFFLFFRYRASGSPRINFSVTESIYRVCVVRMRMRMRMKKMEEGCRCHGHGQNGFEHFGVRARSKGEHSTRPCPGRVDNAPAAMGSRWRFVLYNPPLSLCGVPRLQHVADECRAHVVLCPGTRLRARDNREYHTEKLRGGYWALHFGWRRGLSHERLRQDAR